MGGVLDTTGDWSLMFAFTVTSYVQPLSVPHARYHLLCLVKDAFLEQLLVSFRKAAQWANRSEDDRSSVAMQYSRQ